MEAIVLAGGKGTRLQGIVKDTPKPMALVQGVPFLTHIIKQLEANQIYDIVISIGYLGNKIKDYFGNNFNGVNISYSSEEYPLLTGGAIKRAISFTSDDYIFVLNGDTFVGSIDFKLLLEFSKTHKADLALGLVFQKDCSRFGKIEVDSSGRVINFGEKKCSGEGLINSGVYCIKRDIFEGSEDIFSFEKFISDNLKKINIFGTRFDGDFIDIGVPEDYYRAQHYDFNIKNILKYRNHKN